MSAKPEVSAGKPETKSQQINCKTIKNKKAGHQVSGIVNRPRISTRSLQPTRRAIAHAAPRPKASEVKAARCRGSSWCGRGGCGWADRTGVAAVVTIRPFIAGFYVMTGLGLGLILAFERRNGYNIPYLKIIKTKRNTMKEKIHPNYEQTTITCACGHVFKVGTTVKDMHVGICSFCHPFFTGKQKFVDTAGRVEKFNRRYGKKD